MIKVKPLVWKAAPYESDPTAIDHYAVLRGGWLYIIKQRSHGIYLHGGEERPAGCVYPRNGENGAPSFSTLEAAKHAAAIEWEAFIKSAIEESASP